MGRAPAQMDPGVFMRTRGDFIVEDLYWGVDAVTGSGTAAYQIGLCNPGQNKYEIGVFAMLAYSNQSPALASWHLLNQIWAPDTTSFIWPVRAGDAPIAAYLASNTTATPPVISTHAVIKADGGTWFSYYNQPFAILRAGWQLDVWATDPQGNPLSSGFLSVYFLYGPWPGKDL